MSASVTLNWGLVPSALGYDLYRSETPMLMGTKINILTIHQPTSGSIVSYADNDTNSQSAPKAGYTYYYRVIALDQYGNRSVPTDAIAVTVADDTYVHDDIQRLITQTLKADQDLMALLKNDPMGVRWHHLTRENGDVYPFIVLMKSDWREDKRFRDARHGDVEYSFFVYSNQPSSKPVVDVINRVIKILDGEKGKIALSGVAADIFTCMMLAMGSELYDDSLHLYFQQARLTLTVEFKES